MGDILVFDLETKKAFQEVGGHNHAADLGVSIVGLYSYQQNLFKTFREHQLDELQRWLEHADLLIGFNSKSFDCTVLQPYVNINLSRIPHLDILEEIFKTLGHRLKLESLAQATLLEGKSGDGLEAILYYHRGEWEKLASYCLQDVKMTRDLYEYGRRHGQLWYTDSGRLTPILVRWRGPKTIAEIIKEAHDQNQHVEIECLGENSNNGERLRHSFEIRQLINNLARGWCHTTSRELSMPIKNIFSAKIINRVAGIQTRLF